MDTCCALRSILQVLMTACLISPLPAKAYTYYNCSRCQSFPSKELGISVSDVKQILIDETNDKIIIGARNCLVKLDPSLSSDKSTYKYAKLSLPDVKVSQCLASGEQEEICQNYIRLLVFDNSRKILACGTYAKNPRCWSFETTGPFTPASKTGVNGDTQSPSYPDQNVTGVFSDKPANKNYLYTGINLSSGTRSSTIYRKSITDSSYSSFLRTDESQIKDANFVSSYALSDNFIYFFWREKAIESQDHNIYSRVGRVCTYDSGGTYILGRRFTSFTKARLSCTVPGSVDFSYNHLQSTFKFISAGSDVHIYGVFTTPETGLSGSAVCVYSMKEIQSLFSTSKYLEEVKLTGSGDVTAKAWKSVMPLPSVQDPGRPNCTAGLATKNYAAESTQFAKEHPLLTDIVQPKGKKPLFILPNVRFTQIVVDDIKTETSQNRSAPVLFLATDNGTVYKVAQGISAVTSPRLVEQINVFEKSQPILTMKLYKKSLYIGSSSGVTRVPTNRCSDFKTCRSCIEHQDPYCGWSNKRCTTKDEAGQNPWVQDLVYGKYVSVCPEEPPVCTIKVLSNSSSGDVSLECSGTGIPIPLVTQWQKDSQKITEKNGYKFKTSNSQHSEILLINKFGLDHLGEYQCTVQNNKGSKYTCALPIKGTLPVVFSGYSKSQGQTFFWCKATGIPKPTVSIVKVVDGVTQLIQSDTVSVNADYGNRMYYCIAQNTFGPSKSRNYTINERIITVEIKIKEENWTDLLKDPKSQQYKYLAGRVKKAIQSVYSHDTAFLDITNLTFSKGSVNAEVSMRFAASQSDKDTDLLVDLQEAIKSGKIGSLKVQKTNVMKNYNKGPTQGYTNTGGGIDRGLFVVAILVTVVLSIIVGFLLGIKFHRQAIHSCGSRYDTSMHEDKENQSLKHIKSPTIEETRKYPDRSQTDTRLMDKDGDLDDDDHHSTGSTGGRIVYIHMPDRSSTPERNVLINGKIPQVP